MSGGVFVRVSDDLFDVIKEKHELDVKPVELMLVGEVSSDSDFKMDGWVCREFGAELYAK